MGDVTTAGGATGGALTGGIWAKANVGRNKIVMSAAGRKARRLLSVMHNFIAFCLYGSGARSKETHSYEFDDSRFAAVTRGSSIRAAETLISLTRL